MSRARTIWKWTAAAVGTLIVLLAVGVGVLRVWIEHSPRIAPEVVARVERLTGLQFSFARLDARLGLYGPEIVFRDARITVPGQHDALVTAGAGRVGFDLWRSIRTGRLASGRVVLEGARVYVYVTPKGIELRGQGALGAAEGGAHLALEELPVGHVRIEDATVWVQDLRHPARPWRVDRVRLDLERDPRALRLDGRVRLPDALGARVDVKAELTGDLAVPAELDWSADVQLKSASLAGWTTLVSDWPWLPAGGHGDLAATAAGRGAVLSEATARFALTDVVAAGEAGAGRAPLRTLAGELAVHHDGSRWTATGRGLTIDPGKDAWKHGEFDLAADLPGGTLAALSLRSPAIRLDALAAVAPLFPDGIVREAGLSLAPRGALTLVDLKAARGARPGEWRIDGGLRFTGLGVGAWQSVPGFASLDGDLKANGPGGRVRLHADAFTLDLAQVMRAPVDAKDVNATVDFWWREDGWRLAADGVRVRTPDGEAHGLARLWLPSDAEESPRLVLDFKISGVDAANATKYLPAKRIPASAMDWLDRAFLGGRVHDVTLEFAGETRRFPFRDGGGLFRIRVPFNGMHIHYQDGFADIEDASGEAEFRNEGFTARATGVRIGGLAVHDAVAGMTDFRDAELTAHARSDGDVREALRFLQSSPVGPKLGSFFMKVTGTGPFSARVDLDLPFKRFAEREIDIDARIDHARGKIPGLDDEIRDVTGTFTLRNRELDVPSLTAIALGGPMRLAAHTVAGPSGLAGERVIAVDARGRVSAERLQPQIGITRGTWLEGGFDWHVQARLPRIEWRPPADPPPEDAPPGAQPTVHEMELRHLPGSLRLDATLAGLEINLPEPLAKEAAEVRPLRLDLTIDPGLDAEAPKPPPVFRRRDLARPPTLVGRLTLGTDGGAFEWREDEEWHLARGTLRLGGGVAQLRDTPGVWLEGRTPEYDLSAWLRVHLSDGASKGLGEYLKGGTLAVGRFGIFGFRFPNVTLALEGRDRAWRAQVDGPDAKGLIVVPWQLPGTELLTLDMDRLVLGERADDGDGAGSDESDPTQLPGMSIRVRDLEIQKRHFGSLEAHLSRTAQGLALDEATLKGTSFEASGHGSWTLQNGAPATAVSFSLESTDLLDTLNAWGFQPSLTGKSGKATANLHWTGGVDGDVFGRLAGTAKVTVGQGQVISVEPGGAGRVLGLMSIAALPRRLTLDFSDLTDKGFAFDTITGDFEFRDGNAYTNNLVLKGPAAEIGIVGRTGLKAHDYDQTAKVTGHIGGPLAAAGALAAGPAVGAALLLFSTVFKEPLSGLTRGYYRITGSWDKPKVERVGAGQAKEATEGATPGGPGAGG